MRVYGGQRTGDSKGKYGVRLIRGRSSSSRRTRRSAGRGQLPRLRGRLRDEGHRLAADLFSGAGGLSLGLEAGGLPRHLGHRSGPGSHRDAPAPLRRSNRRLGSRQATERVARVAHLIKDAGIELLAGGPPCQPFSRAGRSKIRHRILNGFPDPSEERRHLWRSFLEVVTIAQPKAVLMENVPDMALDKDMFILRTMVHELESLGYAVEERVVDTSQYGVPQFRQRLILVALRDGPRSLGRPAAGPVTVWNAIGDLPSVEGGWRPEGGADGWAPYEEPTEPLPAADARGHGRRADADRVYDHITRPVRDDDKVAFAADGCEDPLLRSARRAASLPRRHLRRQVQAAGRERPVPHHHRAHRQGRLLVHPSRRTRTLTVREAARLQTFPDRYRFAGPPSAAFRQIGNAVPPFLGEKLGKPIQRQPGRRTYRRAIKLRDRQRTSRSGSAPSSDIGSCHGCERRPAGR